MAAKFTISTMFNALDGMSGPMGRIGKGVNDLGKKTDGVKGKLSTFGKVAGGAFKMIATAAVAATGAVVLFGKQSIDAAAQVEQYKATLKVMLGSQEEAEKRFKEMSNFAATTPFELSEVIELGNQLQAIGRYSVSAMTDLGDLAAASGKPVSQVSSAFAKLATGQKGMAVDMFRDLLISTDDWVKATGKGIDKSGSILATTEEMMAVLPKILKDKGFSGMMAEQSKTFNGRLSNMKDALFGLKAAFGSILLGSAGGIVEKIGGSIGGLTSWVNDNSAMIGNVMKDIVSWGEGIVESLGPAVQKIFPALMNGVGKIGKVLGSALKSAAPLLNKLGNAFAEILPSIIDIVGVIGELLGPVLEALAPMFDLVVFAIKNIISVAKVLVNIIVAILKPIIWAIEKWFTFLKNIYMAVFTTIGNLGKSIWEGIVNAGKWAAGILQTVWSGVSGFFSGVWDGIKEGASVMWDYIVKGAQMAASVVKGAFDWYTGIQDSIAGAFGVDTKGQREASNANIDKMLSNSGFSPVSNSSTLIESKTTKNTLDVNFNNPPAGTSMKSTGQSSPNISINVGKPAWIKTW